MAFTQNVALFSTPLNVGVQDVVDQFNALFGATDKAVIQDLDWSRLQSPYGAGDLNLRVAYGISTVAGLSYQMRYYRTSNTQTAQAAFNADFQGGFCAVPLHFLDVTDHEMGRSSQDQLLVVFALTDRGAAGAGNGLVGHPGAVLVGKPLADIAAGTIGNARIYDANGVILADSHPVLNIDTNLWVTAERAMIIYDIQAGQYIGIPTCCGPAPLVPDTSTTTTPPVPCITQELVSHNPIPLDANAWMRP